MKIFEVLTNENNPLPKGFEYFKSTSLHPILKKGTDGKLFKIMYLFSNGEFIPYVVMNKSDIKIKPIPFDPTFDTESQPNVIHVKIENTDELVSPFDKITQNVKHDKDGDIRILKIRDLPEVTNVDAYTDAEFEEKFNRSKMDYEHGGVTAYLFLTQEQIKHSEEQFKKRSSDIESSDKKDDADDKELNINKQIKSKPTKSTDDDDGKNSKLKQAVEMFKANQKVPRKVLLKRFQSILNLTPSVASTYYTHAKHIVTDPKAKGKVAYWQEK